MKLFLYNQPEQLIILLYIQKPSVLLPEDTLEIKDLLHTTADQGA